MPEGKHALGIYPGRWQQRNEVFLIYSSMPKGAVVVGLAELDESNTGALVLPLCVNNGARTREKRF
jgi:hypothetical protein